MPRVIHTCTHCNKPYTGLKYLINHINKSHEGIDTTELYNQWARHNDEIKTNNRKINRPAIVNNGLTYHQFLSVKTAELKQTRPEITKQSDRIKVIAQMWRERDNVVNVVDEVVDIKSPEPSSVPIPYTLINKIIENKIIDDVIDNVIDAVVNDIEIVDDVIESVEVLESVEVIDDKEEEEDDDEDDEDEDEDDKHTVGIDYDDYLVECYKTWNDGGFLKAYRYIKKNFTIQKYNQKIGFKKEEASGQFIRPYAVIEIKYHKSGKKKGQHETIVTPMTITGIRDKLAYVYDELICNYENYELKTNDEDNNGFNETDWEDVEKELITEDNIHKFFN